MDGMIKLDSVKNKGSRFYFTLPLDVISQNAVLNLQLEQQAQIALIHKHHPLCKEVAANINFHGFKSIQQFDSVKDLLSSPFNPNKVVYLQQSPQTTADEIAIIHQSFPQSSLIIIKHHNDKALDYGEQISAIITYPLLGKRLLTALRGETVARFHEVNNIINNEVQQALSSPEKKVLLVEDNPVNQKVASIILRKSGFHCDIANNGQEALDYFNNEDKYLIIIMDCMMPVMDGFTATQEIRKIEQKENLKRTPIIALNRFCDR